MPNLIKVAIIGTAGRGANLAKLTPQIFEKMLKCLITIIEADLGLEWKSIQLVSGGAAWADHLAVILYNRQICQNLLLYLPTEFKDGAYLMNNQIGKTANFYHSQFSKKMGYNTLGDIDTAINNGCVIDSTNIGFKNRNTKIAKSDYIIAFTFEESQPTGGGTLDTWNKATTAIKKIHKNISTI